VAGADDVALLLVSRKQSALEATTRLALVDWFGEGRVLMNG
jgi:hypothetical protein